MQWVSNRKPFSLFTQTITCLRIHWQKQISTQQVGLSSGRIKFWYFNRHGNKNTDADAMSRYPHEMATDSECEFVRISNERAKAISRCTQFDTYIDITPAASLNIKEVTHFLLKVHWWELHQERSGNIKEKTTILESGLLQLSIKDFQKWNTLIKKTVSWRNHHRCTLSWNFRPRMPLILIL